MGLSGSDKHCEKTEVFLGVDPNLVLGKRCDIEAFCDGIDKVIERWS